MIRRIPQPPIDVNRRATEHHAFRPAAWLVGLGVVLAGVGAVRVTRVPTTDGQAASEVQLTRACAFSGVQYAGHLPPAAEPPPLDNTPQAAEELERWAQQQASVVAPDWKIRIDPRAATRCPT